MRSSVTRTGGPSRGRSRLQARTWAAASAAVLLLGLATQEAAAQALPRLGVLPFNDVSRQAPREAGERAARVLHGLLLDVGKHDLAPLEALWADARAQGLAPPFGVGDLQLLAHRQQLDLVAQGAILSYDYNARKPRLAVEVVVEMADGVSGDLVVNDQASATAEPGKQEELTPDELLVRALESALATIVKRHIGEVRPTSQRPPPPAAGGGGTEGSPPDEAPPPPESGQSSPQPPKNDENPPPPSGSGGQQPPGDTPPSGGGDQPQPGSGAGDSTPPPPGGESQPPQDEQPENPPPPPTSPLEPEVEDQRVPVVEAKVLVRIGKDKVLITLGRDQNVAKGMELEVWRLRWSRGQEAMTRLRIGRVVVTKVSRTDAEARVLEGGDLITTNDLCLLFAE